MITDLNQLNALFRAFRNRATNQDEVNTYLGKVSYQDMVATLDSGTERNGVFQATQTGFQAEHDNWQDQIYGLQDQLKASQEISAKLNETVSSIQADDNASKDQLKAALAKVSDLTAQLQVANDKLQNTAPSTPADPSGPVISKDQQKTIIDSIKALWHKLVG